MKEGIMDIGLFGSWLIKGAPVFGTITTSIIAFMQWRISKGQKDIAARKLQVDLFDRRYEAWDKLYSNMIEYDKKLAEYFDNKYEIFSEGIIKLNEEDHKSKMIGFLLEEFYKFRSRDELYKDIDKVIILFSSKEINLILNDIKRDYTILSKRICADTRLSYEIFNFKDRRDLYKYSLTYKEIYPIKNKIIEKFTKLREIFLLKMSLPGTMPLSLGAHDEVRNQS
ncbi:hypothetical protein [Oecophyllibacter saccharovorans]|uniref:hypothetical protein n=1 Tax=Oecophyllibacter saccharovorans TaxID=2558360 RepID=UPI0011714F84|nr:hypothetical protein [Oecophyllibacter saccharovorans]TPW35139.1 hypothetical protein E3203_06650 [Oecophyllibacter saccharovorans]